MYRSLIPYISPLGATIVAAPTQEGAQQAIGVENITFSLSDLDSPNYCYYGGMIGSNWKINRFTKTGLTKSSATIGNNPSVSNLSDAWNNRLALVYA